MDPILDNAISSLEEGLKFFQKGKDDSKYYKFSIILISHFAELFLKYNLSLVDPEIIFIKLKSKNPKNKTIKNDECIEKLKEYTFNNIEDLEKEIKSFLKCVMRFYI